ncbi:MAG TPA: response regulator [Candidatus Omnitrophota bacterium]|jgi:CheY-like chemotaxis protein|nr:response regulator [Candidatus Omnitrophota bacterium]HRZ14789.1 response regulator [Candidatus Omnitrophota bacterium]
MEKQILIVDDDHLITKSLQKLLKKEGLSATIAANGEQAVELVKNQDFDLIVSDIKMPGMNGIETLKKIRELRNNAGKQPIPEVLITGFVEEASLKNALELKVAGFIYKPFSTDEFIGAVKKNLT